MTNEEKREYDRKRYAKLSEEKRKEISKKCAEYKRRRRKEDPEFAAKEREDARRRWNERNNEAYRAERRAKYAAKKADAPMTEHRKACIESAKKRMLIPLNERAEYRKRQAEEKALQPKGKPGRKKAVELTYDDKVDLLMEQFRLHATGQVRGKTSMILSVRDEAYYLKRILQYDELGEQLEHLDTVRQYSECNIISWKRTAIRREFEQLLEKKYTFIERMV